MNETSGATANATADATTDAAANWREHNRANWDDRVRVHAASDFYDPDGFRAGGSTLRAFELPEVGDVEGLRLLHLQCHMGQDTLSWARLGARVTGLDLSGEAIRTARELARDTGLEGRARFVVSDVYDAPAALAGERFDLLYTGVGALVWLPDLTRWAAVVAELLAAGGALYLTDFHPVTDMLGEDGRTVERDYFHADAEAYEEPYTYTDGPQLTAKLSVQWQHSLAEILTALAGAGLRLEFLHEHDVTLFERFTGLQEGADHLFRFPPGHPRVPLMFSLRATKPS